MARVASIQEPVIQSQCGLARKATRGSLLIQDKSTASGGETPNGSAVSSVHSTYRDLWHMEGPLLSRSSWVVWTSYAPLGGMNIRSDNGPSAGISNEARNPVSRTPNNGPFKGPSSYHRFYRWC